MSSRLFLNSQQVIDMIKTAERERETIIIFCERKGKASKPNGPDKGDVYELVCGPKPDDYVHKTAKDRVAEDASNGVLTVFATNRQNRETKAWGDWRRVNIDKVTKIIYKSAEYFVSSTPGYTGANS